MGDNFAKLAKEIHKRDNMKVIGPCIGTVNRETKPIKVSICDGAVFLEQGENAIICKNLIDENIKGELKKGDKVLCIPCAGEQTWIIVDKVEN